MLGPTGFKNDGRFQVVSALGKGGFGVVYEAYDRDRHARVALKLLHRSDPGSLYRLKQEFRALADLSHPNLVVLHELVADAEPWFIEMELVEGTDFLSYVAERRAAEPAGLPVAVSPDAETGAAEAAPTPTPQPRGVVCDVNRVVAATAQLAGALAYLHGAGTVHRDIKPMNVLVRRDGQVKVLDFGLATDLAPDVVDESMHILGTPAYMSPEQGRNAPLTGATDWYSVGVMLFKALTGYLPFSGKPPEVMEAKQAGDGPAPSSVVTGVPPGLDALCRDLLRVRPDSRPNDADIVARIDRLLSPAPSAVRVPALLPPGGVFVGREEQLQALDEALRDAKSGGTVIAYVHGGSGMGKTALVRHFLQQVRAREPDAVVLAGRCYERESVPYKALDHVVDELSQHLRRLGRAETEALLPRDVLALARLFPVLRRVEAVAQGRGHDAEIADSQELRRRGFTAFRELLARLSDRHLSVIFIDDLQWGDADSAALLTDLVRPPDPPALLLIAAYRSEEASSSVALRMLLGERDAATADRDVRNVVVGELTDAQAHELARALIGAHYVSARAESIVRESGRNPFFIDELVRYSAAGGAAASETAGDTERRRVRSELTLESLIQTRTDRLEPSARRLLEVLSVFGRPLKASLASRAADLGSFELEALAALRSAHLTRARVTQEGEAVEVYHDRIRETVMAHLAPTDLRARHTRLAAVLEAEVDADPEALVIHLQGAGRPDRAAVYAVAAADRAREALAFDRAARLYRVALDLHAFDPSKRREIRVQLGDSLATGGRGRDAALVYLTAAEGTSAAVTLELRRRAADQLLRSGHIEEGFRVIRAVLDAMGMKLARSPARALLSLAVRRAYIRVRGLGFTERDDSQIPLETLARIDVCWSLATALGVVDTIRGADFQGRHLLLALGTGDRYRIARAIAIEAAYAAVGGERTRARHERLATRAAALAATVGQPHAMALVTLARGMSSFLQGRWANARQGLEQAEVVLRDRCTGVTWELDTAHLYHLLALFYLGDLPELGRRLPKLLEEARERDDLMAATSLRTRIGYVPYLVMDDPDRAREEVRLGMARWTGEGFHAQHSWELYARGEVELYAGRGLDAWTYVTDRWPALRRSLLLRVEGARLESLYLRARASIAAAADVGVTPSSRAARLREAARDARRLARERPRWAGAAAHVIQAGVLASRQQRDRGADHLLQAARIFRAADMPLHASAVTRRHGELQGGPDGQRRMDQADQWMAARAIRSPARMAALLAPGPFGSTTARP
jgi:hypothetical protein